MKIYFLFFFVVLMIGESFAQIASSNSTTQPSSENWKFFAVSSDKSFEVDEATVVQQKDAISLTVRYQIKEDNGIASIFRNRNFFIQDLLISCNEPASSTYRKKEVSRDGVVISDEKVSSIENAFLLLKPIAANSVGALMAKRFCIKKTETTVEKTKAKTEIDLPEGWMQTQISDALRNSGIESVAVNRTIGAGLRYWTFSKNSVGTASGYSKIAQDAMISGLKEAKASEILETSINGNRAYSFEVTGIADGGTKFTYLTSIIEGLNSIVRLDVFIPVGNYLDYKKYLQDIAPLLKSDDLTASRKSNSSLAGWSINSLPQDAITPQIIDSTKAKRLALVIGNANYKSRPLKNPRNDADDVSAALKSSGFEVIDLRDSSLQQMRAGVRQFGDRLINNEVGLVYYSGHGIEIKGRNYLIPANADIEREDEVADQGLDMSLILEKMSTAGKGVNILIVDACRDDPFGRSFRSTSRGLAQMDAPKGTIIAYATSPGKIASDGDGRNSPYTKNLVKAMQQPNKPIEQVFKEVRRAVQEETKNQQTPWENTSLSGDFYFRFSR